MYLDFKKIKIVIINLKKRKEKKIKIKRMLKKNNVNNYDFFKAILDKNPVKGCFKSHIEIIKNAKKNKYKMIWIMEDDAQFERNINNFPKIPNNIKWDMLFVGANVKEIIKRNYYEEWNQVRCLTTHSYIIKDYMYDIILEEYNKLKEIIPIDVFYSDIIQKKFIALSHYPNLVKQMPCYSDIEKKDVDYKLRNGIDDDLYQIVKKARTEQKNGNVILKLNNFSDDELPYISIITITRNRRKFMKIFYEYSQWFNYPRNKIEFIVVDDGDEDISDILHQDKRFVHIKLKSKDNEPIPIFQKRNIGVENCKYNYIINCDDDDYYPPWSIKSRINTLLTYKEQGIECVCSPVIGLYDLVTDNSLLTSGRDIPEASMAYTKKFWSKNKYGNSNKGGEGMKMIDNQIDKIIQIPYVFNIIAITHYNNVTGDLRRLKKKYNIQEQTNYFNEFPIKIQKMLNDIKK